MSKSIEVEIIKSDLLKKISKKYNIDYNDLESMLLQIYILHFIKFKDGKISEDLEKIINLKALF